MYKLFGLFCLLILTSCSSSLDAANSFSDEPEYTHTVGLPLKVADTYKHALQIWKTAEDVNAWIATNFSYDMARAIQLSETQRRKNGRLSIYHPSVLFESKTGVCVDLARFGVETLRNIDPHTDPKYLMIEFDPMQIRGNTLRLHWLVSFRRDGKNYFFADSKRPGYIAGPYSDLQAFINDYEQYRGRRIVTFRELESCEKQKGTQARKKQRPKSPNDAIQGCITSPADRNR
jgi:hypothetical protein